MTSSITWRDDGNDSYIEDLKHNTNETFARGRMPSREAKPGRANEKPSVGHCSFKRGNIHFVYYIIVICLYKDSKLHLS